MKSISVHLGTAGNHWRSRRAWDWKVLFDSPTVVTALLVFVGYYLGAKIGFALTFQPHPVSVLWPPNAILLAALLLAPKRAWWILLAAAFPAHWLAQLQSHVPPLMIFCWFISNSCEALIGASCIRYLVERPVRLDRLRNVAIFCFCGVFLGPFISSFLDSGFVTMNHWGAGTYWEIWRIRFTSNVLAALTITPCILSWATEGIAAWRNFSRRRILETASLLLGLLATSFVVFNEISSAADSALLYAPLPFLLWAAVRFGPRGATSAIATVAFLAIWGVAHGHGPFSENSSEKSALYVQVFLIFMSLPILCLAALVEERASATSELRASEERYREVVESQTDLVCRFLPDTTLTFVNEAYCRFLGRTRDELIGRRFLEHIAPGAREKVAAKIAALARDRQTFTHEHEVILPDGSIGWQHWINYSVISTDGAPSEFQGIGRDVTERVRAETTARKREARISLAAESANLALWTIDLEQQKSWMSDKGRQLFGFKPDEPLSRQAFLSRVHPEDRKRLEDAIEKARAGSETFEIEYRLLRPDGETRWLIARGRYLRNYRGDLSELIGVAIDVTEQVRANLELSLQRAEMARLSRVALMGELTASLAHELNQPLTAIASNAAAGKRFLERGSIDAKMFEELLADVFTDARRAGDVIHGIHRLVRKAEGSRSAVNLNDLTHKVLRLLRSDLLDRATTVETDFAHDLPAVQGDSIHLQQVLLNLIMNAVEAMHETPLPKRRLVISTSATKGLVRVNVRDYGTGLPKEDPDKIFSHFFSTKPNGMGMGLTIVRSIIGAHGGELGAEDLGDGARFFFSLPSSEELT
jgi:PAS domain S-box-containing protein